MLVAARGPQWYIIWRENCVRRAAQSTKVVAVKAKKLYILSHPTRVPGRRFYKAVYDRKTEVFYRQKKKEKTPSIDAHHPRTWGCCTGYPNARQTAEAVTVGRKKSFRERFLLGSVETFHAEILAYRYTSTVL